MFYTAITFQLKKLTYNFENLIHIYEEKP